MKVHCVNILLFALPLNILAYNYNKPYINHAKQIPKIRLLCECDLYMSTYDNDPDMKSVKENFDRQTSQRFEEYNERMITQRKKCKEQRDKDVQKIILKDKLEKQMEQQLTTLETKIYTHDIPTCVCEKSIAEKVEKTCLKCTQNFGGIVAPSSGVLGGIGEAAISLFKPAAITAAEQAAVTEATSLATKAGINTVVSKIKGLLATFKQEKILFDLTKIVNGSNYKCGTALFQRAEELASSNTCIVDGKEIRGNSFCTTILRGEKTTFEPFAQAGIAKYETEFASQKELLKTAKVGAVESTYASYQTAIIASIVAIVVIVLIMVIIYLILRYRRKKKMKKKLQYIKLLEK